MGADAIRSLLSELDIPQLAKELQTQVQQLIIQRQSSNPIDRSGLDD